MNKYNAKYYLPLVQALADGKVIQEWCNAYKKWCDTAEPDFAIVSNMYRIKPEAREVWINSHTDGRLGSAYYDDK